MTPFSSLHLATLAVSFLGLALFMLALPSRGHSYVRYTLAAVLLGSEGVYQMLAVIEGRWSFSSHLPLELCSLTSLGAAFLLLFPAAAPGRLLPFFVFFPVLLAFVTPVPDQAFPHPDYFRFFVQHTAIYAALYYVLRVFRWYPDKKDALYAFLLLQAAALLAAGANWLFQSNYMFLQTPPPEASLYLVAAAHPWYFWNLELLAAAAFAVTWLLFRRKQPSSAS
ncbi:TIGR02206 family membrane protein [Alkalicoccus urumqiensis]|uniref:TIGR02206 family membrane protein n=1 Tax=Alkalicoccus urumqiensis TaxID=1548213 RepID=A0A2P6MLB8_ALKUR|nr:TIGR02206 family membrane protein [Alkalicoccus urumqiensis]PRO67065.1 TIGR02206 family membrane protein [Alkalicoccus urumqiensis]